jgi:uracil-DNA glycosylase
MFDCYHCSRYNTNTGRLNTAMFEAVFAEIARHLGVPAIRAA